MLADDDRDINPDQPLSPEDALLLATRLHRLNHLQEARELYGAVLQIAPEHPMALQFLGILEHQSRNSPLALQYLERALVQLPGAAGVHQNLGNILLELARLDEAAEAYQRCAQLGGKSAELLCNIGVLQRHRGRMDKAEEAYQEALSLDPNHVDAYLGYGRLLAQQERHKEALVQYSEAVARDPAHASSRHRLGLALCILGRFEEAAQVYRDWVAAEPDNPSAKHYLAACTGQGVPARASDAYVASTFDDFAQSFDAKLEALDYCAPRLVGEAVQRLLGEPKSALDVLDAGCGTGLCAPMLAPFARALVGVDLSGGMLTRAKARGGYQALYRAELTAFVQAHPQRFDLIVSADTLCYFGALEAVCLAASAALRPGGRLIFTVEALSPQAEREVAVEARGSAREKNEDFVLQPFGRYGHASDYLRRALAAASFEDVSLERVVLRTEAAEPVAGYLVTARRPGA